MPKNIRLLDESTINKIAAGEVVERPASVVKELLENSIDASSTSITVEIKEGGKSYIRVTDNGTGIEKRDIDLAFLRHSTSKITESKDLQTITTLGFRGEALASIASISQVELITKTKDELSGVSVVVNGGEVRKKTDIGCPRGTTIIVKNLFFNTPVRKKFLKSNATEASHITDIVFKLALGNPSISFNYIKDNKTIIKTPGRGDLDSTVYSVLGRDFKDSTFKIDTSSRDMTIKGFIGKLDTTRTNRNSQYLFINGRYVRDSNISKTVEDAYNTLIPNKRYPVFLLFLTLNPETIDINVHPTKTEVRFTDREGLNRFITRSVREVLENNNLIQRVSLDEYDSRDRRGKRREQDTDSSSSLKQIKILDANMNHTIGNTDITDTKREENVEEDRRPSGFLKVLDLSKDNKDKGVSKDVWLTDLERQVSEAKKLKERRRKDKKSEEIHEQPSKYMVSNKDNYENISKIPDISVIGTLFNTYILGEDRERQVFYMIDQHAAHERIMYEKLREQFLTQDITTQMLLNTEVLELSVKDRELVKDNIKVFTDLGFEIEEFGENTIALRGVPLVFGRPNSKKLFLDILDNLSDKPSSNYEFYLEKIMKLACTSAIKANDVVEEIEIDELIKNLRLTKDPFTCPHGRPIIIEMSKREIEKRFKRV